MPLDIPVLTLRRALANLKQPHRHPRTNLGKLNTLIASFDEYVVAHFDRIFDVLKCDDARAQFRTSLSRREEVLENLYDSASQGCREAFEDEMRVGF